MSAALVVPEGDLPTVYLNPGQIAVHAEPTRVSTILGSCVAVCLWDDTAGVGGINHFVLPEPRPGSTNLRFAEPAMDALLEALWAMGARNVSLRAKLFGGAGLLASPDGRTIGMRNVEVARALLGGHRIPVLATDVGGKRGRKLLFETYGGAAWVRLLHGGQE